MPSHDSHAAQFGGRPHSATPTTPGSPLGGLPSGFPSEAELARLANQLYSTTPGGAAPLDGNAAGAAPMTSASLSAFGFSEEERLQSTLSPRLADRHGGASSAAASPATSASAPAAGALPTGLSGSHGSSYPPPAVPKSPCLATLPGAPSTLASAGASPAASPFYFLNGGQTPAAGGLPSTEILRHTSPPLGSHAHGRRPFDVQMVRRDFPILAERVNGGKPLVWLDNAATTHKPAVVIERLSHYYRHENSNVHRAAHELAARSTDAYENARETIARFLNAPSSKEIVFVRGATEAINLVAESWGRQNIGSDDKILITHLEHHANIVPWQRLCAETGAKLLVAPVNDRGELLLEDYQKLLGQRPRLVAFPQVSNALGTVTPAKQVIDMAHRAGALALVDGAQSIAHMRQDVSALDADFFVFSGHKVFAPTGIGVLYGKADLLDSMPPWQGGGNMIQDVTLEESTYQAAPQRFEAGTGSIADAVGLGAAIEYLEGLGIENVARYEHDLLVYATAALSDVKGLRLIGTALEKASVLSFIVEGLRTEDVGAALSSEGIAVRAGHHCAQPILRRFGLENTVRASLALYNTPEEVDVLADALKRLRTTAGVHRI